MTNKDPPWPKGRPRPTPRTEYELYPRNGSWLDLMPKHAGRSARFVFACLEYGALEAWQDRNDVVRLYLPESVGGHLIVGGPEDLVEPPELNLSDPAYGDPDAMVRREGIAWITLLPGIRRTRTRPQPARIGSGGGDG